MASVELDPFESSLMSYLSAQHEAVNQMIDLRDSHFPGSAEQKTIKELGKEPGLPRSKTDRARSRRWVPG